jgi:hypothetical protein
MRDRSFTFRTVPVIHQSALPVSKITALQSWRAL